MRVVLDTNVIVSAHLKPSGYVAKILEAWHEGAFDVVVSEVILAEYQALLLRPQIQKRHQASVEQVKTLIDDIRDLAFLVHPAESLSVVTTDPDDNMFLECAVEGNADYIISGDSDLLEIHEYRGIQILRPVEFITVIEQEVVV